MLINGRSLWPLHVIYPLYLRDVPGTRAPMPHHPDDARSSENRSDKEESCG